MRYCVDTEVHFTVLEITIEQLTSHIEQHAIVPSAFDFDDNAHWRSGPTVLTEGKSADQNVNELCGIASEARSNLNLPISNDAAFFEITFQKAFQTIRKIHFVFRLPKFLFAFGGFIPEFHGGRRGV